MLVTLFVIDHAEDKIRSETYTVFIVVDGAITFVTAFEQIAQDGHETVQCLMAWMDTFQCTPQSMCADMAFQSTEVQECLPSFWALKLLFFFHGSSHTMAEPSRSSSSCFV